MPPGTFADKVTPNVDFTVKAVSISVPFHASHTFGKAISPLRSVIRKPDFCMKKNKNK